MKCKLHRKQNMVKVYRADLPAPGWIFACPICKAAPSLPNLKQK